MIRAVIRIRPKRGVRDPEGRAIAAALKRLGFEEVGEVRRGKHIEVEIEGRGGEAALKRVKEMCETFLANPVTEDYEVELAGLD